MWTDKINLVKSETNLSEKNWKYLTYAKIFTNIVLNGKCMIWTWFLQTRSWLMNGPAGLKSWALKFRVLLHVGKCDIE